MTLVTTSRRSTPLIRSIAKVLAFASEGCYLSRGKHGLREIAVIDPLFFVLTQEREGLILSLYDDGVLILTRLIRKVTQDTRAGPIQRAVITSDRALSAALSTRCKVILYEDQRLILSLDGPQRIQIILELEAIDQNEP